MIQSKLSIIDEILRNEHHYRILERAMQFIISFISINFRTQKNSFIAKSSFIAKNSSTERNSLTTTHQMISFSFFITDFFITASNIVFDLEKFLFELEKMIFERDEIEKKIFIDEVRVDSQLKRIILTSFNENEVIMRRIVEYDDHENKMLAKAFEYKIYRETSLKTKNIVYRREWKHLIELEKERKVFNVMTLKKWTNEWEIKNYDHLKRIKHVRVVMTSAKKRKILTQKEDDSYQKVRDLERNIARVTNVRKAMNEANESIDSLTRRMKKLIVVSVETKENEIRKMRDDFIENLAKMIDEIALTFERFQKDIMRWKI